MTTDDKSRAKLRLVIECLLSCTFTEGEEGQLIEMGRAACSDPAWTDYLYWPNRHGLDGSIDAALDKAFAFQPIILGPPRDPK
jgi:hypothetical protein